MSNNTNIAIDIEAERMGVIYKAGDKKSLEQAIKKIINNPNEYQIMQQNCRRWAKNHDFLNYCSQLYNVIHSKFNEK